MKHSFVAAALLLASARQLLGQIQFYQVEFTPSGRVFAKDLPVTRGAVVVFHEYPGGMLVSIPRSKLKRVVRAAADVVEASIHQDQTIAIGNLAMQGGAPTPSIKPAASTASSSTPRWNGYDSWAVLPDEAPAAPPSTSPPRSP